MSLPSDSGAKTPLDAAQKIVAELTGMASEHQSLALKFAIETLGLQVRQLVPRRAVIFERQEFARHGDLDAVAFRVLACAGMNGECRIALPYAFALGLADTAACQRFTLARLSGIASFAGFIKSTATNVVMSATE